MPECWTARAYLYYTKLVLIYRANNKAECFYLPSSNHKYSVGPLRWCLFLTSDQWHTHHEGMQISMGHSREKHYLTLCFTFRLCATLAMFTFLLLLTVNHYKFWPDWKSSRVQVVLKESAVPLLCFSIITALGYFYIYIIMLPACVWFMVFWFVDFESIIVWLS
jgi:hypothetical protein